MRCFIGVSLRFLDATERIGFLQQLLKNLNLFEGAYHLPENFHITLKFLGEISEEEVQNITHQLSTIELHDELTFRFEKLHVSTMNDEHSTIRSISCLISGAGDLQTKINEIYPPPANTPPREYHHCTLVSVMQTLKPSHEIIEVIEGMNETTFTPFCFKISEFHLFQSILRDNEPPLQSPIHSFRFTKRMN